MSLRSALGAEWHVVKSEKLGSLPAGALFQSATLQKTSDREWEAIITAVVFPEQSYKLQVVDNPARDKTLAQRMREQGFLAGVNGGYFHADGRPLGFIMSQGKKRHSQETAPRLLSGYVIEAGGKLKLLRVGERIPASATEVLQAGPFLMDHNAPVGGLERKRRARRTFVATDGHGFWMIGVISPVTLAETALVLRAAAPLFFLEYPIERALNLDGGSSSALWVELSPEPFSQSEIGGVRNFLGITLK